MVSTRAKLIGNDADTPALEATFGPTLSGPSATLTLITFAMPDCASTPYGTMKSDNTPSL